MKWFVKCLRHYADFRGRASMPEFWYFVLGLFLVLFLLLAVILGVSALCTVGATSRRYVVCLVGLPFVMPYLAVMVRRLHDCGRSGVSGYDRKRDFCLLGISQTHTKLEVIYYPAFSSL